MDLLVRYRVERRVLPIDLDAGQGAPAASPMLYSRFLDPERYVDVTPETRDLARQVLGTTVGVVEQARRIYDHLVGYMTYDAGQQSWTGSTEHGLVCSVGNCNDIHALFISLCRSIGLPARLMMGQALETPEPDEERCELCGYHCWAEFFAAGLGWVPVDASCACKYGKHLLFGSVELNHVAWAVGRDVLLQPAQQGERLLYFVAPYAEVNGELNYCFTRSLTFAEW